MDADAVDLEKGTPASEATRAPSRLNPLYVRILARCPTEREARVGRPPPRPDQVAGDKGHSSRVVRRYLQRRGIAAFILTKADEEPNPRFDPAAHRERHVVERLINRDYSRRNRAVRDFAGASRRAAQPLRSHHEADSSRLTIAALVKDPG